MSRYINRINTPFQPHVLEQSISKHLSYLGFSPTIYKGYTVWKKGHGILTGPQYIAVFYDQNFIQIEAFIKFAILPGVYTGEEDLSGFVGMIPKESLKKKVIELERYIYYLLQTNTNQGTGNSQSY